MGIAVWVIVTAVPVVALVILAVLLNRWGTKHDPMGSTLSETLKTPNRSHRAKP